MPAGYTTEGWGELFLAEAGASAALAGLLFVAVSINLDRIIALRNLPGAALGAIALLVAVLMVSTFALVPEQPRWALGIEVLVVGLAAWSILTAIWVKAMRAPIPGQPRFVPVISTVVTQAATLPLVIAGVSLLLEAGGGLYWLVPGWPSPWWSPWSTPGCCWSRWSADAAAPWPMRPGPCAAPPGRCPGRRPRRLPGTGGPRRCGRRRSRRWSSATCAGPRAEGVVAPAGSPYAPGPKERKPIQPQAPPSRRTVERRVRERPTDPLTAVVLDVPAGVELRP
jgi:hypothetical protein